MKETISICSAHQTPDPDCRLCNIPSDVNVDKIIDDAKAALDPCAKCHAEIGRLTALAGPSGKSLKELEEINDMLLEENERLRTIIRRAAQAELTDVAKQALQLTMRKPVKWCECGTGIYAHKGIECRYCYEQKLNTDTPKCTD